MTGGLGGRCTVRTGRRRGAAGAAGYVIVGHQPSAAAGTAAAAAWYSRRLTGWRQRRRSPRRAAAGAAGGQMMNAVTATARGFTAVGAAGAQPGRLGVGRRPELAAGFAAGPGGRGAGGA